MKTMTVHEARNCWCPFARTLLSAQSDKGKSYVPAGVNRWDEGFTACIGAACMAWRSTGAHGEEASDKRVMAADEAKAVTAPGYKIEVEPAANSKDVIVRLFPEIGYCALVGGANA